MKLTQIVGKAGRYLKKHLPTILSVAASAGVVGTAYLAAKAAPKASTEEKTIKKVACYIPTGLAGAATIACIVASDRIHVVREAGLILSYNTLAKSMSSENLKKIAGTGGSAAALKMMDDMMDEKMDNSSGREWFYDEFASVRLGRAVFYQATWKDILMANMHMQDHYYIHGDVSAKQYYEELLKTVHSPDLEEMCDCMSYDLGWTCTLLIDEYDCCVGVPFNYDEGSALTPDGDPCTIISFEILPEYEEF